MEIRNHLLSGPKVIHEESLKNYRPLKQLEGIIIHYTAGASAMSSVRHLCSPLVQASAHIVIGRDGYIYQMVPFNIKAWHAGKSSYMGRTGMNDYTLGIELDNYGQLTKEDSSFTTSFGRKVPTAQVWTEKGKDKDTYWHDYPLKQLKVAHELCKLLIEKYDIEYIAGHSDITSRKQDPGPAFPLDDFKQLIP